ncbi:MAG: sugar transferase [Nitrospirota bacterium]|nr:MAG: sugar transferase [Nitrospirota bacterium]
MPESPSGLTSVQAFLKRSFDVIFSFLGLALVWWVILISYILASIDTRANGFFIQKRIGRNGELFSFVKLRTMRSDPTFQTNVTTDKDPRITRLGRIFRKTKIDELPQLIHVLLGQMSFVGPRPDVPGFADKLEGQDRMILNVRPGITGPATLKYRNEEEILARQKEPENYNRKVIWPEKTRLNLEYVETYSFWSDIGLILKTVGRKPQAMNREQNMVNSAR